MNTWRVDRRAIGTTLLSVLFCLSHLLSPFTPTLIGTLFLGEGHKRAAVLLLGGFVVITLWTILLKGAAISVGFYGCSIFLGYFLSEIVRKGVHPVRGILFLGPILSGLIGILMTIFFYQIGKWPSELVREVVVDMYNMFKEKEAAFISESGEGGRALLDYFAQHDLVTQQVVELIPGYILGGIFLVLWMNTYFLLRTRLWSGKSFAYTEKSLLAFRMPDWPIWLVITSLGIYLLGDKIGGFPFAVSKNVLLVLGIFYFFQGLGIYVEFLTSVKLRGPLLALLVIFAVFQAHWVLAGLGLFDMWINFRKFFNDKKE